MKRNIKAALMVVSLLGLGLGAPLEAATAKKQEPQASKKVVAKSATKPARKMARKAAPSKAAG